MDTVSGESFTQPDAILHDPSQRVKNFQDFLKDFDGILQESVIQHRGDVTRSSGYD
jgi:hypothetical protein